MSYTMNSRSRLAQTNCILEGTTKEVRYSCCAETLDNEYNTKIWKHIGRGIISSIDGHPQTGIKRYEFYVRRY